MVDKTLLTQPYEWYVIRDKVPYRCDYCGEPFYRVKKGRDIYFKKHPTDACTKHECQEKRREEICLKNHGAKTIFESKEFQENLIQHNLEKYGCKQYCQSEEFKVKRTDSIGDMYKTQKTIQDWLNSYEFNFHTTHEIMDDHKEIDMYDKNVKLAIEYTGLFWHTELSKTPRDKNYHYNKYQQCKEQGITLLTIFEDEWQYHQEKCKNIILSLLGIFQSIIYARKCEIIEVDKNIYKQFLDQYHLQGSSKFSKKCFGLQYENELIGMVTVNKNNAK